MPMIKKTVTKVMTASPKKGAAMDMVGRALGKKTSDAMGRAMAKTAMKKGGMAKKSSKKC